MIPARLQALWKEQHTRTITFAVTSLIGNLLYAFYHGVLGLAAHSPWLLGNSLYYLLLTAIRFTAVVHARTSNDRNGLRLAVGVVLIAMSALLAGLLHPDARQAPLTTIYGKIPMITIATVTFAKLTIAAIDAVRHRSDPSTALRIIRTVRYAEVAVSLCTMQHAMLATFGDATSNGSAQLNRMTGIGVCVFILFLGIHLINNCERKDAND